VTVPRSLRVGLIGYGLGGSTFHAPLISATPGLELTAIATSDPGRVQAATARHPHARIVPAADHLFKIAPALDLVVVSTPHHTHAPLATAALAAGCHVVIDKPSEKIELEKKGDEAWAMLGPGMQEQGRERYDAFWRTIDSVDVQSAEATPGSDSVQVTLVYHTSDGRTSTERKVEGLVKSDNGGYLIDSDEPAG